MVGSTNQVFRRRLLVASCLMACATCLDHLTMCAKPVLEPLSLAGIAEFIKSGRCSAGFFFWIFQRCSKKNINKFCHTIPRFPWAIFPNKFLHHFLNIFPKLCPIHQTLSESYPQHFPPSSSPNSNIFLTISPTFPVMNHPNHPQMSGPHNFSKHFFVRTISPPSSPCLEDHPRNWLLGLSQVITREMGEPTRNRERIWPGKLTTYNWMILQVPSPDARRWIWNR